MGAVLLAVGLADIAVIIYCIANEISYASSFNVFAVAAGVLLRRGSLRVASWVQWFSTFMLSAMGGLLFWTERELGREPVRLAAIEADIKQRNMRVPAFGGIVLVAAILLGLALMLNGESAAHAKSLASQQIGPGFRFHVSSMQIHSGSGGTIAAAQVTAWNDAEVRKIQVKWTAP